MAEGGSTTSEKCALMTVAVGEILADEDESAIIVCNLFCNRYV